MLLKILIIFKVLAEQVTSMDVKTLRNLCDQLKQQLGKSAIILLALSQDSNIHLVCGVSKDIADVMNAGELVNYVAQQIGGKGGGRSDMAQGGGNDMKALKPALDSVFSWVKQKLVTNSLS